MNMKRGKDEIKEKLRKNGITRDEKIKARSKKEK